MLYQVRYLLWIFPYVSPCISVFGCLSIPKPGYVFCLRIDNMTMIKYITLAPTCGACIALNESQCALWLNLSVRLQRATAGLWKGWTFMHLFIPSFSNSTFVPQLWREKAILLFCFLPNSSSRTVYFINYSLQGNQLWFWNLKSRKNVMLSNLWAEGSGPIKWNII